MPVAIAIALLVLGSVLFHLLSPWWQTPLASNWGAIDSALNITLWICGAVFVILNLFLAYTVMRFRHRPGHKHRRRTRPRNKNRASSGSAADGAGVEVPG